MNKAHYYLSAFVSIAGFTAIAAGKILMSEDLSLAGILMLLFSYVYYLAVAYIDDKNKN